MNTTNALKSVSITIPNPTPEQIVAIAKILGDESVALNLTAGTAVKKTKGTKAPAKTVSPDEDEDFATDALDEEELTTASDDPADYEDDEDEEPTLQWADVKSVINKYGKTNPEQMKAILLGFNIKGTKELEQHSMKWEPVYRKVLAKMKAAKKK